jgi:hypothetical protein
LRLPKVKILPVFYFKGDVHTQGEQRMPRFLPIKFSCFDVAETVGIVRGEEKNICRYKTVVLHPDDVTHLQTRKIVN